MPRSTEDAERRRFLTHTVVDQAVGVLIARSGCTSAEAFAQLADIAQRTGRELTEIAADLVGAALPQDPDADAEDVRRRPAVLAMDRAADGDDLASLLIGHALGWAGPSAAVVAVLHEDGALDVIGAAGIADRLVSPWRRIPPVTDCLLMRAVRARSAVWIDAMSTNVPALIGEPGAVPVLGARVAVPLMDRRRVIGAVEIAWPTAKAFSAEEQREIVGLAESVATAVVRTLSGVGSAGGENAADVADAADAADVADVADVADAPPAPPPSDDTAKIQRLGRVGTWEWDLLDGEARWSSEALRVLGSRAALEPTPIASPPYVVHPDDTASANASPRCW